MRENSISEKVIGAAIEVHRVLGPGLLESVYEDALCHELFLRNIKFERQKRIPVPYKGIKSGNDLRLDLIIENALIVELKAKETVTGIDRMKVLTYLKISNKRLGLIINFHVCQLKKGIERIINSVL